MENCWLKIEVTHRRILLEVWGPSYLDQTHYVRIYMGHLRHKLEVDPARPRYILTETGLGYRLLLEEIGVDGNVD